MFDERKLKKISERKLSDYANAESSLARLKKEQREEIGEETLRKKNAIKKAIWSFSAAAFVMIAVGLIWINAPISSKKDSIVSDNKTTWDADHYSAMPAPEKSSSEDFAPNGIQGDADERISVSSSEILNAETVFLKIELPSGVSVLKQSETNGYSYSFSLLTEDAEIDAIVAFGGVYPESFPLELDRETIIANRRFEYKESGGVLYGVIRTDRENVYIMRFESESEERALAAIRALFTQK